MTYTPGRRSALETEGFIVYIEQARVSNNLIIYGFQQIRAARSRDHE